MDPDDSLETRGELLHLVSARSSGFMVWPPRDVPSANVLAASAVGAKHDELVARHCVRLATLFLERHSDDSESLAICAVLEYLLFKAEFSSPGEFVPTGEILDHLREAYSVSFSEQQFRSNVVARLRDSEVVLASGPKGYKIPTSSTDLRQYVSMAHRIVLPMLTRLSTARDSLRLASGGAFDILEAPELEELRKLIAVRERDG